LKRAAILLSIALLSAGCATTREAISLPELDSWETRTAVLGELREWEFRGRIAVKAGDEGFNGKIRWIQIDETFNTTVGGPIGIGTVRIEGSGQTVSLTDKDGVRTELQDAELELRYRYGWTIPLRSLRYWALGVPDPALAAETRFGEDGQLEYLSQRGWDVAITRYREGGGQSMPNRLSAENGDTTVRLVIDSWYFFK
jgi:outer membrane lipoprotein LolB